jgi:hypothetical protein
MLHKAQIGILTCRWKREEVFKLFSKGLRRLCDTFDLTALVVGSEGTKTHCEGFYYLDFPNDPLGRKWNAGMKAFSKLNPDYVMIIGSDDFVTDNTMQYILDRCNEGFDVIGMRDCYFYDSTTERLGYWKGFTATHRIGESMGMCRTLSKRVLDLLRWEPWYSKANAGLDWTMTQRLKGIKHTQHVFSLREQGLFAVDYKSVGNICSFEQYDTELMDNKLLKQIPEL